MDIENDQQGILDMNHLMIKIGDLINPNANSTKIVTQMQHGHMQVRENMQACTPSAQSPSRVHHAFNQNQILTRQSK